jgi:hypothetical protein
MHGRSSFGGVLMNRFPRWMAAVALGLLIASAWWGSAAAQAPAAAANAASAVSASATAAGHLPGAAQAAAEAEVPSFNGADTAWMLISTVLVMLMTMPGIILFYGGMLRSKNALSIVAHTVTAASVITSSATRSRSPLAGPGTAMAPDSSAPA